MHSATDVEGKIEKQLQSLNIGAGANLVIADEEIPAFCKRVIDENNTSLLEKFLSVSANNPELLAKAFDPPTRLLHIATKPHMNVGKIYPRSEIIMAIVNAIVEKPQLLAKALASNESGYTPLHYLFSWGNQKSPAVRRIIQHILSVIANKPELFCIAFTANYEEITPLHIAFRNYDDPEIIKEMKRILTAIADKPELLLIAFSPDRSGDTPLHVACRYNNVAALEAILPAIVDKPELLSIAFSPNTSGDTPLHHAAIWRNEEAIKLILSLIDNKHNYGLLNNLFAADHDGRTPLELAPLIFQKHALHSAGVDRFYPTITCQHILKNLLIKDGLQFPLGTHYSNALFFTYAARETEAFRALSDLCLKEMSPLELLMSGNEDLTSYQKYFARPYHKGPLLKAVENGNVSEVGGLIGGVDPGSAEAEHMLVVALLNTDDKNNTALHLAFDMENKDIFDLLCDAIGKLRGDYAISTLVCKNNEGKSVLQLAHEFRISDKIEKLLVNSLDAAEDAAREGLIKFIADYTGVELSDQKSAIAKFKLS